jgi:1-acyl-sn-glycerol-3-phosphate acyltransferase
MNSLIDLLTLLRGLFVAIYLVVVTAFFSTITIIISLVFRAPDFALRIDRILWAKPIMFLAGIEVEYREEPGFPDEGFLYLFNHTSYNDIIAMFAGLRKPPKFGAKAELFDIPIFGLGMRSVGTLAIHRDKRDTVLKIYRVAKLRVDQCEHLALAPEGTRQTSDELGKFKKGPFIFAIHAEMPIVPLVISGARQTQPKGHYLMNIGAWKRKIIVKALSPVDASNYSEDQLSQLQHEVRDRMDAAYSELKSELGIS